MNPLGAAAVGGALGALTGHAINDQHGAAIGGVTGALVGYAFAKSYNASKRQRAEAQHVALSYVSKPKNAERLKKKKTRYVAVPVKSEKTSGNDVVLYDTKTNTTGTKAYETPSGKSFNEGDIVDVGGKDAMVATSFQGL